MKLNKDISEKIKTDIIKIISEEMEEDLQHINLYLYTDEILSDEKINIGLEKEIIAKDKTGMVFADLAPEYNWSHPCKYFLYSLNTNKVIDKIDAEFPPSDFYSKYDNYEPFHQPIKLKNIIEDRKSKAKNIPFLSKILNNAPGNRYAILFSGMSNNRHTNDLEFLYRTLISDLYEFEPDNIYVLNHNGSINYDGPPKPIGNWPGDNTPYIMPVFDEGSKVAFENVFDLLTTKLEKDDLLLIHTNNHGGQTYLCCYSYPVWEPYYSSDFANKLSSLPQISSLIVMMEQCHSGGFSNPIISNSPALRTHFAAACEEDKSSIGGQNFDPFAYDWIAAVTGQYADGSPLHQTADTNADNRISAKEAFEYADAVHNPYDTPNSADSPPGCGACLFLLGFDICLKVYFDYPSAGWKDNYRVIVEVENIENFGIEYNLICTEVDNKGNESDISIGAVPIPEPGTYQMTSSELCKDWPWFLNAPCAVLSDEVSKLFNYEITFTVSNIIENGVITPVTENNVIIIILNKIVAVSSQKLSHANNSFIFCAGAITHYALAAFFFASIPFCPWCLAIALTYAASAEIMRSLSVALNNQANDPIEFDKDYNKIHDFSSIIRKFKVEGLIPIHIKRFADRYNKIDAQFNSLDITYNRFYSSLSAGDKGSAKIQKERAIDLAELMEEKIIKLKNHLLKIKKFDEDLKKAKIREDHIEEALKEVKEKGLSEEFKENLRKEGLSEKMIDRINESSKQLRKEDIKKEIFPSFQDLYRQILDGFIIKKEKIKEMKRVEGLSEDALARRLLKEGLAEPKDYYKSGRKKRRRRA